MKLWKITGYLSVLINTWCGLLFQQKFNKKWDTELNTLMDNNWQSAVLMGEYTIKFNSVEVWVRNRYYSYGHNYSHGRSSEYRPSIKTMVKLNRLVEYLKENNNDK